MCLFQGLNCDHSDNHALSNAIIIIILSLLFLKCCFIDRSLIVNVQFIHNFYRLVFCLVTDHIDIYKYIFSDANLSKMTFHLKKYKKL